MAQQVPQPRMLRGDEAQLFRDYELPPRAAVRCSARVDEAIVDDACSHAWLQLMRCQPDRETAFAWLRTVAVREAWRLSKLERRDVRLDATRRDATRRRASTTSAAMRSCRASKRATRSAAWPPCPTASAAF